MGYLIKILIVLFFLIISAIILYAVNYYSQRHDLLSKIKKIRKSCYSVISQFNKESYEDVINILKPELDLLKTLILDVESTISKPPANKKLPGLIAVHEESLSDLEQKIADKKSKWEQFVQFKDYYNFNRVQIRQKINEVREHANVLTVEKKEYVKLINEKTEEVINLLKNLINEYDALYRATFNEFNFLILEDVERETDVAFEEVETLLKGFKYFSSEINVYIVKLQRKSSFYITLEEEVEDRRNRERVGEIAVSYKTFKEAFEGKKYKRDTYISGKRSNSDYSLSIKVVCDAKAYPEWTQSISYEEFLSLFSQLPIDKQKFIEVDDNCCPYELDLSELNELAWEKSKFSFALNIPMELFSQLTINDILNVINGKYLNDDSNIIFKKQEAAS